ncbi:MAG: radical SAM protein [Syntrophaceae bacterium]|nr:radical SAM protein [Syntrophaceae bacterium]
MAQKMDIIKKLSQGFVLDKIKETDWTKGSTNPLVVELDATEECDLACPGCVSEDIIANKGRFSNERLLSLGVELKDAGVKALILIGGGEPLMHPAIGEFIKYLGENDIHLGITTNGTSIDKYMDVIAEFSSWTRISLDASTEKTFNRLRPARNGESKFNHVINSMKKLAKIKKGKMGFSFLIRTEADGFGIKTNIHEIFDAAVLARDIGCDYFEVKPSYVYAGGVAHALVVHSKKQMQEARSEINRLDTLMGDSFKIMKAINLEESLSGAKIIQTKNYSRCPVSELRTLICPSGVFICPYWRGKDKFRIGDVNNMSFSDMWNGKRRQEVMKFVNPSKKCTFHCLRHESNIEILRIIKDFKNGKNVDAINEYDRFI